MYKLFNTTRDATLYSQQPTSNTGLDEVLEIGKTYYGDLEDKVRTVIKFSNSEISSSLAGLIETSTAELVLRECESEEVPTNYFVMGYPVTTPWDMGIGTRFDDISTDGATWRNAKTSTAWSAEGGDFVTNPSAQFEIQYLQTDIVMDISALVSWWLIDGNANEGLILKLKDEDESGTNDFGILQYFSKETNTIYQPKLRFGYDDSVFNPGSLTALDSDDIHVTFKRLRAKYKAGSTAKIIVVGREKYPLKQYSKQYGYTDIQYLPETTYYQIKDSQTDEIILPYSDYTKVSCDGNGNYFNINFTNWEVNRDYYIEIKTIISGSEYFFSDDNLSFNIMK